MQRLKSKVDALLKWGEQHTKTDISYLTKGGFWLSLDNLASMISAFVLMLAFGNLTTPEIFGTYRYVLSVYALLAISGLAGFDTAVTRAVAKNFEGEFWRGFKIKFFGALLGSLSAFAIGAYYFLSHNPDLGQIFLMIGFALPFLESAALYQSFLNGKREFKILSLSLMISQVFATLTLLAAIFLKVKIFWLLFAYFASWTIIKILLLLFSFKKFQPNNLKEEKTIKLGANLTFMDILDTIAAYLDRIALFHFFGAIEVAVYSFAIAPVEQIKGAFKSISNLALPRFSQRTEMQLKKTFIKKMFFLMIGAALIILLYIIIAPIFFKIFLPKYLNAVSLSQVFAVSLLTVASAVPINAIHAIPKIKSLYFYNILTRLITIGLILLLIPLYGLWGAIIARVMARFAGTIISYAAFKWI